MSTLKTYYAEVLGRQLPYQAPASAEEIDRITGKPNHSANCAMKIYDYQVRGPAVRKAFAEALEAHVTALDDSTPDDARKFHMEPSKREGGEPNKLWDETETKYENRLVAGERITEEEATKILASVNESFGDWSPTSLSDRKPGKQFYEKADVILGQIAAGKRTQDDVVEKVETFLGVSFESTFGDFNRDNYARAIVAINNKVEEQRKAALSDL